VTENRQMLEMFWDRDAALEAAGAEG